MNNTMLQKAVNSTDVKKIPLVSILINNYNYARFLKEAIDSAFNQTYPYIEVIVVDDGSTDNSQEIINSYENRLISVLKENGGQASAFNACFEASKGEIILFLDADDAFYPTKVKELVDLFAQVIIQSPNVTIFNSLAPVDEKGLPLGIDIFSNICELQDLRELRGRSKSVSKVLTRVSTPTQVYRFATKYRFIPYLASPTSGLAMTRSLAERIFPLPWEGIRTSADDFLVKAASLLGEVYSTEKVLSQYRIHGNNHWYGGKKLPQKDFLHALDEFLNLKLKSAGKEAVFSYFNSIHAKSFYRTTYQHDCSKELFDLAIKVVTWHTNLRTIIFFVKTIGLAIYFAIGGKSDSE